MVKLIILTLISSSFVVSHALQLGGGSVRSSFFGSNVIQPTPTQQSPTPKPRSFMEMKKGKPNVPPNMRGQYKQQQQMNEMKEAMAASRNVGEDGFPVFNLFVQTDSAQVWYPCGSFKGDERSKALCDSYTSNPFLGGLAKKQLDSGVANSIFDSLKQLVEGACRQYPQLRKQRENLTWGYKLVAVDLTAEQKEMIIVTPVQRETGFLGNIKTLFG